jgi:hypothetical protein
MVPFGKTVDSLTIRSVWMLYSRLCVCSSGCSTWARSAVTAARAKDIGIRRIRITFTYFAVIFDGLLTSLKAVTGVPP